MPHNIDLALLRAFATVAETGGMTQAGRVLNLTQAAISQQIKRLEDFLQTELFHRSQRQVKLTAAGERLLAHTRRILALNDEIWALMTAPEFEGEVRLGVPHDIVGAFMPAILRSFAQAWPRIQVMIQSETTPILLDALAAGALDLTLTTEEAPAVPENVLLVDQLVWVGAQDGTAHHAQPLPIALGCKDCAFRATAVKALSEFGSDWRLMCQVSSMGPMFATIEADLAVGPFLSRTVPDTLAIIANSPRLPPLPSYFINLRLPVSGTNALSEELIRHIRQGFASRHRLAA